MSWSNERPVGLGSQTSRPEGASPRRSRAEQREDLRAALQQGSGPIHVPLSWLNRTRPALGDTMLTVSALKKTFHAFAKQLGADPSRIQLAFNPTSVGEPTVNLRLVIPEWGNVSGWWDVLKRGVSVHQLLMEAYAEGLGITLSPEELRAPPELVPLDVPGTPLGELDLNQARRMAATLRGQLGHPFVLVCQTGSSESKRFSTEQAERIAGVCRAQYPNARVYVMTDAALGGAEPVEEGRATGSFAPSSLTEVAAYLLAASAVVTTDSFWSHLAGALKAYDGREPPALEPGELTVLHTVGSSVWAVPGATTVLSPALEQVGTEHPTLLKEGWMATLMGEDGGDVRRFVPGQYEKYFRNDAPGIDDSDIVRLTGALRLPHSFGGWSTGDGFDG